MTFLSDLLHSELAHWREQEVADKKNIVATNGATCEVLHLIDRVELVDRDYLLSRYKSIKSRKPKTKMYALANTTMARDKMRLEAIKRVGNKIKNKIENEVDIKQNGE